MAGSEIPESTTDIISAQDLFISPTLIVVWFDYNWPLANEKNSCTQYNNWFIVIYSKILNLNVEWKKTTYKVMLNKYHKNNK